MERMAPLQGNRNWNSGQPFELRPRMPTEFETVVQLLRLSQKAFVFSLQLRQWCEENKNRCYVSEWLLAAWNTNVNPDRIVI